MSLLVVSVVSVFVVSVFGVSFFGFSVTVVSVDGNGSAVVSVVSVGGGVCRRGRAFEAAAGVGAGAMVELLIIGAGEVVTVDGAGCRAG